MSTLDIRSVTPTTCRLMGVEPPALNDAEPALAVLAAATALGPVERVLVYAPDAVGKSLLLSRPELLERVRKSATVEVELRSMIPAKTPVCFASMFTGALPEVHGIRKYERPVLTVDTLFDAMARAERRVAIVAVAGSSMDIIFRNRPIDYFTEPTDPDVTSRALELMAADQHHLVVAYHMEHDDLLHKTTPDSAEAIAAAGRHVQTFADLGQATDEHWAGHTRALVFAPDHGAHTNPDDGKGTHGDDVPADMEVLHFWRLRPAAQMNADGKKRHAAGVRRQKAEWKVRSQKPE